MFSGTNKCFNQDFGKTFLIFFLSERSSFANFMLLLY